MSQQIKAEVIADSQSPCGIRLTTLKISINKALLGQYNTHRMLSKNFSSSRAIPIKNTISSVRNEPIKPIFWGKNQKGMQSYEELSEGQIIECDSIWNLAAKKMAEYAETLEQIGLHKQYTNRLLEPFLMAEGVTTATEWDNFFNLRIAHAAQPEICELAKQMKKAMEESIPKELSVGQWHIPFIMESEQNLDVEIKKKISAARCARVSYKLPENNQFSNIEKDIELHDRLLAEKHFSPFEHQAEATLDAKFIANFRGWRQYRKILEAGG